MDPTGTLVILGKGTDAIVVDTLDPAFNSSLEVYGSKTIDLSPKPDPSVYPTSTISNADGASLFDSNSVTLEIADSINARLGRPRRGRELFHRSTRTSRSRRTAT